MNKELRELKAKASTVPKSLAGAVMHTIDDGKEPVILAIGADAVNAAIKSVAIAVSTFAKKDRELVVKPYLANETVNEQEVTVTKLWVMELTK